MKVLYVGHSTRLEGAERCYLESIISLQKQGVEVICVLPADEGPLIRELNNLKVKFYQGKYNWWMSYDRSLFEKMYLIYNNSRAAISFLIPIIRTEKPDVIITNTQVVAIGGIAARLSKVPHIWYIHEFGEEDHGMNFRFGKKISLSLINRMSDLVLVNSDAVLNKFIRRIQAKKLGKIWYAVENVTTKDISKNEKDAEYQSNKLCLILAGRLAVNKRQEDAVQAVSLLVRKGYNVHLTILGGGQHGYSDYIKDLINELQLSNYIELISFTSNPISYMMKADIGLMCSTNEAFGRVTIESMKLGKPVIGANGGATPELIKHGYNGFLYEPTDVNGLANHIEYLYLNKDKINEMGLNAKSWALSKFNYDEHGRSLKRYISEVISG